MAIGDLDRYVVQLAQLVGGIAFGIEHGFARQHDVVERLGQRVEPKTFANGEIIVVALVWRQLGQIALDKHLFHDGGAVGGCEFVHFVLTVINIGALPSAAPRTAAPDISASLSRRLSSLGTSSKYSLGMSASSVISNRGECGAVNEAEKSGAVSFLMPHSPMVSAMAARRFSARSLSRVARAYIVSAKALQACVLASSCSTARTVARNMSERS